jgi:hypothetical protein
MKNTLFLAALSMLAVSAHAAQPNRAESLNVPFCEGTRAQLSKSKDKADKLKYAQEAATRYYPYLDGALRRLLAETAGSTVCSRILVIGKNDAYMGLSKLKYFIRYEISAGRKLVAAIPILMVNTSEQGHMNPGEKQWMSLDTAKTRGIMSGLVTKYRPTIEVEHAPEIEGPDFTSFIHLQPIGRMMVAPENTLLMSLGTNKDGEYFLLTGFYELRGMYESQITTKALLFLKDKSGKLFVSNDMNAYTEIMAALSDARKKAPPAADLEGQIRATLEGARMTDLLD